MEFCPTCGNMLQFERMRVSRFRCAACPYIAQLEKRVEIKRKVMLAKKPLDPIVSKEDIPKGDETEAMCPRCGHNRAYFKSMQIRSADEPESRFYRCLKCEMTWREE